jgi:hypothetical protein
MTSSFIRGDYKEQNDNIIVKEVNPRCRRERRIDDISTDQDFNFTNQHCLSLGLIVLSVTFYSIHLHYRKK